MRTAILVLLSILVLAPPLFVGRAGLRQPLSSQELGILMASASLAGDRDLQFGAADQLRLSRHRLESIQPPTVGTQLEARQPLYSLATGPLAVLWGDAGLILANGVVFVLLLWSACRPRLGDPGQFWWGLSYFLVCAYPVLVWKLDEAVLLGGALYLAYSDWSELRPRSVGFLAGALLPTHAWLLPAVAGLYWMREPAFRRACLGGLGFGLLVLCGLAGPVSLPAPPVEIAATAGDWPQAAAAVWQQEGLGLAEALAHSWPSHVLLGRLHGILPSFLPWLAGLCLFLGYERNQQRRWLAFSLLASLVLAATPLGPDGSVLAPLLPAFFVFTRPIRRFGPLVGLWTASSLFTAVLFLNPIHSVSHPADPLTLWPHRILPLEIGTLDSETLPVYQLAGSPVQLLLPGRDAWLGTSGQVVVRGKRWGHLVLRGPRQARTELMLQAPVDLGLELQAGSASLRLDLKARQPVRVPLPEAAWVRVGNGFWGMELLVHPSSGLVPRLQPDGGNGVDYIGVEIWPVAGRSGGT